MPAACSATAFGSAVRRSLGQRTGCTRTALHHPECQGRLQRIRWCEDHNDHNLTYAVWNPLRGLHEPSPKRQLQHSETPGIFNPSRQTCTSKEDLEKEGNPSGHKGKPVCTPSTKSKQAFQFRVDMCGWQTTVCTEPPEACTFSTVPSPQSFRNWVARRHIQGVGGSRGQIRWG